MAPGSVSVTLGTPMASAVDWLTVSIQLVTAWTYLALIAFGVIPPSPVSQAIAVFFFTINVSVLLGWRRYARRARETAVKRRLLVAAFGEIAGWDVEMRVRP